MSFPRYPAYKPSGVEWLGEVPEHWALDRMKWAIEHPKNGIWGNEECGDANDIPCVRVADFDRQRLRVLLNEPTIRNVTPKEREGRVLATNDLLIEKSGGGELQPVGCVVLYEDRRPAICSNFVAKATARLGMSPSFWCYLHSAAYTARVNTKSIKQTSGIQNLDQSQYLDESACYPPLLEQEAIATFLDRETAKIDALIAEQQRLIELLQEKRQAVISHAVTKGLNPDAPMKDSGVEWLGEVPEDWAVWKTSQLLNGIGSGTTPKSDTIEFYEDGAIPWVVTGDLNDSLLCACQNRITEKAMAEHTTLKLYPAGSVAVAMYGATIGKASVLDFEATVNQACCVLPPSSLILGKYLLGFILAAREHLLSVATGGGQPNINQDIIRSLRVPLPSLDEQFVIVGHIENVTGEVDSLLDMSNQQIHLLQERRSALISAAVTGQIDVRGLVPKDAQR